MDQNKQVYQSEVMALPPLHLVQDDPPCPEPDGKHGKAKVSGKPSRELEIPIRKLIAYLRDEKN